MKIPKITDSLKQGFLFKILAIMLVLGNPFLQGQEDDSEIVDLTSYEVIGSFSESLVASLDTRREATQLQDSIFAEDMGKFPDLNLAEALQRLPGVAILRDNGEGRQIQIRGLGSEFVRILLNDVPLSTASSGRSVD